ncbi:MAG: LytTR family DNA-binding domain-containing protein [Candidatus Kapaibacterium sp.]
MVYNSGDYRRVSVFEIIVIKSNSNYSTFYLDDGSKILTSKTLKYWEVSLNHPDLVRVHDSSLINRSKIKSVNVGNSEITLTANLTSKYSRMPKSELLKKLNR